MNIYSVRSYKPEPNPVLDGQLTQCDAKDPEANYFTIACPSDQGLYQLEFDAFFKASRVANALNHAVRIGRNQAFSDLRNFIGVE